MFPTTVCTAGYAATVKAGVLTACTACTAGNWVIQGAANTATSCAACPLGVTCTLVNRVPTAAATTGYSDPTVPATTTAAVAATSEFSTLVLPSGIFY